MVAKRKIAFNQENSSSSTDFLQTMPGGQGAPKTVRRNARERNRVKQIDVGFEKLRTTIPNAAAQKKISRVKILASAVDYIQHLHTLISEHETVCRSGVIIKQEPMSQANSLPTPAKGVTAASAHMMPGHQYSAYSPYHGHMPAGQGAYPHYSPLTPHSPMSPMSAYPSPMSSVQWTPHSDNGYYSGHSPVSALTPRSTNTCQLARRVPSHARDSLSPGSQSSYSDSFMSPPAPDTQHQTSLTQDPTPSSTFRDEEDILLDSIAKWEQSPVY